MFMVAVVWTLRTGDRNQHWKLHHFLVKNMQTLMNIADALMQLLKVGQYFRSSCKNRKH